MLRKGLQRTLNIPTFNPGTFIDRNKATQQNPNTSVLPITNRRLVVDLVNRSVADLGLGTRGISKGLLEPSLD